MHHNLRFAPKLSGLEIEKLRRLIDGGENLPGGPSRGPVKPIIKEWSGLINKSFKKDIGKAFWYLCHVPPRISHFVLKSMDYSQVMKIVDYARTAYPCESPEDAFAIHKNLPEHIQIMVLSMGSLYITPSYEVIEKIVRPSRGLLTKDADYRNNTGRMVLNTLRPIFRSDIWSIAPNFVTSEEDNYPDLVLETFDTKGKNIPRVLIKIISLDSYDTVFNAVNQCEAVLCDTNAKNFASKGFIIGVKGHEWLFYEYMIDTHLEEPEHSYLLSKRPWMPHTSLPLERLNVQDMVYTTRADFLPFLFEQDEINNTQPGIPETFNIPGRPVILEYSKPEESQSDPVDETDQDFDPSTALVKYQDSSDKPNSSHEIEAETCYILSDETQFEDIVKILVWIEKTRARKVRYLPLLKREARHCFKDSSGNRHVYDYCLDRKPIPSFDGINVDDDKEDLLLP